MKAIDDLIDITNFAQAQRSIRYVTLGHYFVFVEDTQALEGRPGREGRRERLLLEDRGARRAILPLIDNPVQLSGIRIRPPQRSIDRIGCLVADRDLYRAEQDTVHLFTAFPAPPSDLQLHVACNGEAFTERTLALRAGMAIETLSMLLPGRYKAQLVTGGRPIGSAVSFTVAEYTLAPLSARLLSHQLDRANAQLAFELAVESYQIPFSGRLRATLIDPGREVEHTSLQATAAGHYSGQLSLRGEGPFRLRLSSAEDAARVAEIAIPGSRVHEREVTLISELGQEFLFSMMPEPEALAVRGGYLSAGDFNATPLIVPEVVTDKPMLQTRTELESLVLVALDLTNGTFDTQDLGAVGAGSSVNVPLDSPFCTVFAGGFVQGRPFEGYTTFVAPAKLEVDIEAPPTLRPREDLVIQLTCRGGDETVPVLLGVRDERLTAVDRPEVSLGTAAKQAIEAATAGMAERGLTPLGDEWLNDWMARLTLGAGGGWRDAILEDETTCLAAPMAAGMPDSGVEIEALEAMEAQALAESPRPMRTKAKTLDRVGMVASAGPARSEFPEVLFYGIVPVPGRAEVVIPLADSMGTFTVEAFALSKGDWQGTRTSVVVDQPVRVDLDVPPAVHPGDRVAGYVRVSTASSLANVLLTCDGAPVALRYLGESGPADLTTVKTPTQLEFDVAPGTYRAMVKDLASGETDSTEMYVGTPGRLRSYAKQIECLQPGESLTLDSAAALSLRVLPAVDEPFDSLVTATAGYAHLCCEQTAAKILAAVFMYLTAKKWGVRTRAEEIILAGIARERKMWRPGQGFAMYPSAGYVSDHYSRLAVRYLWTLDQLDQAPDVSAPLRRAVEQGVEMANLAAKAHRMRRVPKRPKSLEEAYATTVAGGDLQAVKTFIEAQVDFSATEVRMRQRQHQVADRARLAYAAASLLALGDWSRGVAVANQVTRQFNAQGTLYSTVDSVAAIVLLIQLRAAGIVSGVGRVRVNGQAMTSREAAALSDPIESIEVLEGVVPLEVTVLQEEDWRTFTSAFPLKVGFWDSGDRPKQRFSMGDRAELRVSLPQGYQPGDLLHVSLPAGMSWIHGGGKVKRFTLDFTGQDELRVPVVVTSKIAGKQHFALCVRNMFQEERVTSPGLLSIRGLGWF